MIRVPVGNLTANAQTNKFDVDQKLLQQTQEYLKPTNIRWLPWPFKLLFNQPKAKGVWGIYASMFSQPSLLALGLIATRSFVAAGPCDIYASGNNPCVAAHGTTRALYSAYTGPLYQVSRGSDGATTNIGPLSAGGVANAAAQDSFCAGTTCLITIIYDQSGRGNHLTQAPPGGFNGPDVNGLDNLASAIGAPVTLNGQKAYGVFVSPGTGYRNNAVSGTATGNAPEGMYVISDLLTCRFAKRHPPPFPFPFLEP